MPNRSTKTGIGISPMVMNPSTEEPQPSPRDENRDGPASGRNAATMLRSTVKAASPEAEYSGYASMMYACVGRYTPRIAMPKGIKLRIGVIQCTL